MMIVAGIACVILGPFIAILMSISPGSSLMTHALGGGIGGGLIGLGGGFIYYGVTGKPIRWFWADGIIGQVLGEPMRQASKDFYGMTR